MKSRGRRRSSSSEGSYDSRDRSRRADYRDDSRDDARRKYRSSGEKYEDDRNRRSRAEYSSDEDRPRKARSRSRDEVESGRVTGRRKIRSRSPSPERRPTKSTSKESKITTKRKDHKPKKDRRGRDDDGDDDFVEVDLRQESDYETYNKSKPPRAVGKLNKGFEPAEVSYRNSSSTSKRKQGGDDLAFRARDLNNVPDPRSTLCRRTDAVLGVMDTRVDYSQTDEFVFKDPKGLRIFTYIAAAISLIEALFGLSCGTFILVDETHQKMSADNYKLYMTATYMILHGMTLLSSALLAWGNKKCQPALLIGWISLQICTGILYVIGTCVYLIIELASEEKHIKAVIVEEQLVFFLHFSMAFLGFVVLKVLTVYVVAWRYQKLVWRPGRIHEREMTSVPMTSMSSRTVLEQDEGSTQEPTPDQRTENQTQTANGVVPHSPPPERALDEPVVEFAPARNAIPRAVVPPEQRSSDARYSPTAPRPAAERRPSVDERINPRASNEDVADGNPAQIHRNPANVDRESTTPDEEAYRSVYGSQRDLGQRVSTYPGRIPPPVADPIEVLERRFSLKKPESVEDLTVHRSKPVEIPKPEPPEPRPTPKVIVGAYQSTGVLGRTDPPTLSKPYLPAGAVPAVGSPEEWKKIQSAYVNQRDSRQFPEEPEPDY